MDADVTIGIMVQDDRDSLKRCLHGLFKNTGYPFNLCLIVEGDFYRQSTDLSISTDTQWIINMGPHGFPHCANLFIDQARTPYLVLLRSTTYVTRNWLNLLTDCLKSHPEYGIAGPSTSWAWNEQQVVGRPDWGIVKIEDFGHQVEGQYNGEIRLLDRLHSVGSFCYAFKHEVIERIGYFDERYGQGPCSEIDYSTRAARAGYKCVWVCGAYVHHFPPSPTAIAQESKYFQVNKKLYQQKFCGLQLVEKRRVFCEHCTGEVCEHFAPLAQTKITYTKQDREEHATQAGAPLVSCIMPTYNRRMFVPQAIKYFLRQDYPRKELVIVDDGTERVSDLIPSDERIKYIRLEQKASIGYKRNLAVQQSQGDIIAHWDDDDWYAENRISYQIQPLLQGGAEVSGLEAGFIYSMNENLFWSCESNLHAMMFYADIHGGSIVFKKDLWEKYAKYPDISLAEDAAFLRAVSGKVKIVKLLNKNVFVYVRHGTNSWEFICGKFINPGGWHQIAHPAFFPAEDLLFYQRITSV